MLEKIKKMVYLTPASVKWVVEQSDIRGLCQSGIVQELINKEMEKNSVLTKYNIAESDHNANSKDNN